MKITINQTPIVVKNDEFDPVDRAIEYYALRNYPVSQRRKLSVIATESGRSKNGGSASYLVEVLEPVGNTRRVIQKTQVTARWA